VDDLPAKSLVLARRSNPAWLLLASRRAPLVLACLKPLFESERQEIPLDDAREKLSRLLAEHANNPEFEITDADFAALARRELRDWIRRGILVERGGDILATDSLQTVFRFLDNLENRVMTSTASRLATVQQKIESIEAELNPDKQSRIRHLESKIADLQAEVAKVHAGEFTVLDGARAQEELRELYSLAMSLRADFKHVEDSYREADRQLRQSLIGEQHHRGEVLDQLLDKNDALLDTPEGRVFDGFHRQISQSTDLDRMRARLRVILSTPAASASLDHHQTADLRSLVSRLLEESAHVMRARARSERDVRGFIKSGLAGEHHRVGHLLRQLFETALEIDWAQASVRRAPAPLPPLAPAQPGLPVPGRLCFKSLDEADETTLNLDQQPGAIDALEQSLRETDDDIDREALHQTTLAHLRAVGRPLSLASLARDLTPRYDLESLLYWLALARESGSAESTPPDTVELVDHTTARATLFTVPAVSLAADTLAAVSPENLE
jgi:hypothetical protein